MKWWIIMLLLVWISACLFGCATPTRTVIVNATTMAGIDELNYDIRQGCVMDWLHADSIATKLTCPCTKHAKGSWQSPCPSRIKEGTP